MTRNYFERKRKTVQFSFLLLLTFFLLVNIQAVSAAAEGGARLAFALVLPALFPFLILSSLLCDSFPLPGQRGNGIFARLFKLPLPALLPLILGLLSGFPIGAKAVSGLYQRGFLTKEEGERLLLFVNNTGPAFLLGGVGALFQDIKVGVFLLVIQAVTALFFGFLLGIGKPLPQSRSLPAKSDAEAPSLVKAVSEAVTSALQIAGFIILFQVILTIFRLILPKDGILLFSACILEISNAVSQLAALSALPLGAVLPLLAFTVSFSGLSVYMQTAAVLHKSELSLRFYLPAKLFQGIFAAALTAVSAPLFL